LSQLLPDSTSNSPNNPPSDGPWSDPTQAYFWPIVNKRPTWLWPRYFLAQPEAIFFWPEGQKIEKVGILRGNFPSPNLNQRWLTRPNPSNIKLTGPDPGQKFLTWTYHYPPILNPSWTSFVFQTSLNPYLSKMFDPWTSLYEYLNQDWWLCLLKESQIIREGPWPEPELTFDPQ